MVHYRSKWLGHLAIALGLLLSACVHNVAAAAKINNIVLVHGAFADGSSWSAVTARLQEMGYHVTAVQNPLTSLADDVEATERVLQRQQGDVLLVGHSWAGAVVTQAGNAPNVRGIVYLSALVPDSGESVSDLLQRLKAPMAGMAPDANGLIWLDNPEQYREVMAGDVPLKKAQALAAVQQPIAAKAFGDRVQQAAWKNKPTWYLLTEKDKALNPSIQKDIASHIGAKTQSISSSHMSLVSHPEAVADFIASAAKAVK
ncbi:alpha/beta hydrolase [Pectobacterium versatile]|uniref:alpha/beta fold hydrolase n=1 Tax=Pectobacterium versatile TaxID=2488639 RepID=UPI00202D2B45|nr:alpha/beta hydrolase [Pectobacterium carotovorum]MCL6385731.1 alpha/beta hydrolase [Pectobacterium carotovorum subsp. carotovorum]GKX40006.1 alpha/beta hydrolase [Pectobacterium carotovorum subsp. carotovorum]GLX46205.1 alpha/beta hydrolase [Pectobacterium carotovorum subsp. carotovorum]